MLDISFIKKALPDFEVEYFDTVDSTNSEARRRILAGEDAMRLYIADSQTGGRGRMGRSFYSPGATGVYLSFAYKAGPRPEDAVLITSQAAVAVAEAIESLTEISCGIKWVNDIYIGGKKAAGILAESVSCDSTHIILGIGINFSTESFPPELTDKACSLNDPKLSKSELITCLAKKILHFINHPEDKDFIQSYKAHSIVLGQKITYIKNSEVFTGTAIDISDSGHLSVRLSDGGEDVLSSGEISLRL